MFISDFAIKRPIITITVMIFLVVAGIYALIQLEVDEFPDIDNPIVAISVPYPGAAPETVEREVVDRIEEAVSGINGIDRIQSVANDGFAQIIVFFDFEKSVDQASQDVRDAISSIRGELPQEIEEPILRRFDPADFPIVTLTLSSPTLSQAELTQLADPMIKRELSALNGVATVNVVGGAERELTVELRPRDLAANGVGIAQVVQALQSQNLAAPVGRVNGAITERTIRLQGRLERPEEFLSLVVAERNGRIIRLGDVANIRDGTEEPRSMALFNGRPAVGIEVLMAKGKSTTTVADEVRAAVAKLQQRLPPGAKLDIVQDAGVRVRNSVHNVEEALVEGALLTILVVFLFLNSWRSTVITGLALPVSVLAAFIPVWLLGFSLNTMSLLGLSLAIGILIDDAIVVRENIVRHIEMGEDHYEASRKGTAEIGLAVAATTFSIVAVFVPVGFMYGIAGQWFKPFALTIAAAVLVSLFVSFSLDPMLSAYWADPQTERHERTNPIARALDRFNAWFDRQADNYKRVIAWALDHRWAMVGIATGSFVLAFVLQGLFGGGSFFPDADNSELNVQIETPPGSNLEYTRLKTDEVARIIRAHPEVAYTYASIGGASGSGSVDQATLYVKLVPKGERRVHQSELAAELRQEMRRLGGVTAWIFSGGMGGPQKQIQVELRGPDATTLTALAERMAAEARKVPGAADVGLSTRGQKPELEIEIKRGVAGALGVTTGQIAQALRPAFAGIDAGDWVDPTGETRDVEVRLTPEARQRAADLRQLPLVLQTPGNAQPTTIPLEQVATIREGLGPAQIDHLDRDKVVTIGANVEGRDLSSVSRDVNEAIRRVPLPPGYRITQGGQVKDQAEVFTRIFAALGFAILLMYFILVVQFGSFLDPLAILLSLPLSLIGVVVALILTGDTLNLMSLIGVILLAGIVAKNAILLIDFAKWGMERGMSRRDALIEAGRIRLRPILMTTFALIAGMVPVALGLGEGADFRAPLGRAVIGGVITSTLLTLLVIPTVYEILDEWKEAFVRRFFKGRARAHAAQPEVAPAGD
ncbi:MAG: efflux RND transporter permease subunit [Gemmatimonadetes bacterium]|nr:efflux RND transporter permease subunit [Gemmatimonadota bacterium]